MNTLRKILTTTALVGSFAFAGNASAVLLDFADYADNVSGEMGGQPIEMMFGNYHVEAFGASPGPEPGAYLDEGNAGLGVCGNYNKFGNLQCVPNSDDNVEFGETLHIHINDITNHTAPVTIEEFIFKTYDHSANFDPNATVDITLDHAVVTTLPLTNVVNVNMTGNEFEFTPNLNSLGGELYLSAIRIANMPVPSPAPLALMALGLIGVYRFSRKQQKN